MKEKRMMKSTSICHATSSKLIPWDDVSFHINIYMSCHINIVSTLTKGGLIVDGRESTIFVGK
jgi:hypothetical protein